MNRLRQLTQFGQSIWFDNIQRAMVRGGELANMIKEDGLRGVTSNPTIFEKAIGGGNDYDAAIGELLRTQPSMPIRDLFFSLAIEDIQGAADLMAPVYRETKGVDGYVSLEVSPDLAYNTHGTIDEARRLWKRVNRPNLMIKVPATKEGLPAIEQLIADGLNINVTLLFSVDRYREVALAYIAGLEARLKSGQPIDHVASVASFFVSRVDAAIDKQLAALATGPHGAKARSVQSKIAIANAKLAYALYKNLYADARFAALRAKGAVPQRLLWASTGTKSAELSDVLYIEELIGADTVNTVPPATYKAFKEHGTPKASLDSGLDVARAQVKLLGEIGVDLSKVTTTLEKEGVESFVKSFTNLLGAIDAKAQAVSKRLTA